MQVREWDIGKMGWRALFEEGGKKNLVLQSDNFRLEMKQQCECMRAKVEKY